MTPSNTVGDALKSFGLPSEKTEFWNYGIDLNPFKGLNRPVRSRPVFGYFGTLMPHKGVHIFVEAAAKLESARVGAMIRGSASQNPGYVKRLKKLAGSGTVFKEAFSRAGVRDAFAEIDVLVLPSLWLENSPVVIQEAHACGCPVVASDLGGMRELVKDRLNGRLFPPGDVRALAAILDEAGTDPGVITIWREEIEPPRSIENDVSALDALYGRLRK
jgi:glycosyltransferase involved in cell wall biosynthesis